MSRDNSMELFSANVPGNLLRKFQECLAHIQKGEEDEAIKILSRHDGLVTVGLCMSYELFETAIHYDRDRIVAWHYDHGFVQVDSCDGLEWPYIFTAIDCGSQRVLQLMIDRGASLDVRLLMSGQNCLERAVGQKNREIATLLYLAGARMEHYPDWLTR